MAATDFVELKTTDGQTIHVRADAIHVFEVVPGSARVDGHIKIFINGYKFLIQMDKDEFLKLLSGR